MASFPNSQIYGLGLGHTSVTLLDVNSMPIYPLPRVFYPKIVGTFYMQEYKVKEKTAIVPPVSKLSGHPGQFEKVRIGHRFENWMPI